jgi:hypothetical protein
MYCEIQGKGPESSNHSGSVNLSKRLSTMMLVQKLLYDRIFLKEKCPIANLLISANIHLGKT